MIGSRGTPPPASKRHAVDADVALLQIDVPIRASRRRSSSATVIVIGATKPGASKVSVSEPVAIEVRDLRRLPRGGRLVARDDLVDGQRGARPTRRRPSANRSPPLSADAERRRRRPTSTRSAVAPGTSDVTQRRRRARAAHGDEIERLRIQERRERTILAALHARSRRRHQPGREPRLQRHAAPASAAASRSSAGSVHRRSGMSVRGEQIVSARMRDRRIERSVHVGIESRALERREGIGRSPQPGAWRRGAGRGPATARASGRTPAARDPRTESRGPSSPHRPTRSGSSSSGMPTMWRPGRRAASGAGRPARRPMPSRGAAFDTRTSTRVPGNCAGSGPSCSGSTLKAWQSSARSGRRPGPTPRVRPRTRGAAIRPSNDK